MDNEAATLVYGIDPVKTPTSGGADLNLPVNSAVYNLSSVTPKGAPSPDSSVFIPVPPGYTLLVGAFYSTTGTGGIFVSPVNDNGTIGDSVKLTEKPNTDSEVVTDQFSGSIRGVRLWVGRTSEVPSSVTIAAMTARLIETSDLAVPAKLARISQGPWIGGQGHSGCRFLGTPSYVTNSPVEGGRVGFAASFVEVGSWIYG